MTSNLQHIKYTLRQHSDYSFNSSLQYDDNNIATILNKYYDTMTPEEMRVIVTKCMSEKEMRTILLKHELKFYTEEPKTLSLEIFTQNVSKLLKRYQSRAGGFLFEDNEWSVYDANSRKYDLYENEVLFENTIHKDYIKNLECAEFLSLILKKLNQMTNNIKVTLHSYLADRDQVYFVILKCCELNNS